MNKKVWDKDSFLPSNFPFARALHNLTVTSHLLFMLWQGIVKLRFRSHAHPLPIRNVLEEIGLAPAFY